VTLSPVFRSVEATRLLESDGIWERLAPSAMAQAYANTQVMTDLPNALDSSFLDLDALSRPAPDTAVDVEFVQQFFFLILFRSVLETVGVNEAGLALCAELNFCIKGTITSADNLFDDQDKSLIAIRAAGSRFRSIVQLLVFERATARALDRGVRAGTISPGSALEFQRDLLTSMTAIGALEGSEEAGVAQILAPEQMLDSVHRLRGGALFELAFIAPRMLAQPVDARKLASARAAVAQLGTAFQIVDDLVDFEFDVVRGRHNLLASQIVHQGSAEERAQLAAVRSRGAEDVGVDLGVVAESAGAVLERGRTEARAGLQALESIGFWFPARLSDRLLNALVGDAGVQRMSSILSPAK
jgi:hypothetical protein